MTFTNENYILHVTPKTLTPSFFTGEYFCIVIASRVIYIHLFHSLCINILKESKLIKFSIVFY